MKKVKLVEKKKKFERCVYCGGKTSVAMDQHVDQRSYYIEGVGQLCYKCGPIIYGVNA